MTIFKYDDVYNETIKWFNGDKLATSAWISKYALRNTKSDLLEKSPTDMICRIRDEIYRIEQKYNSTISKDEINRILKSFGYFVFGGSPMFGIGNKYSLSSLGNCFVAGNEYDSYSGIMKTDEELVNLMKRRAGVGISISHLRPKSSLVSNAAKTSTGVVSFMNRYSNTTEEVAQEGRRGALMITIDISHPDVKEFITIKSDRKKIRAANISVKVTDEFMNAAENDSDYILRFPIETDITQPEFNFLINSTVYDIQMKLDNIIIIKIKAKQIWDLIIEQAHKNAEPGVLFWDTIIRESPADSYSDVGFKTISTNPCGEIPLSIYDSCRLGALNLYQFVKDPFTKNAKFDFISFSYIVYQVQRFMDDLIELENEKIDDIITKIKLKDTEPDDIKDRDLKLWESIKEKLELGRRTGLGVTGLGDMLAALDKPYATKETTKYVEKIFKTLAINSYKSSISMAKERGSFLAYDYNKEKDNIFINRILNELDDEYKELYKQYGRRNIANLTVAPTGTLSLMTRTTSGIEPVFKQYYKRRRKVNSNDDDFNDPDLVIDDNGIKWKEYFILHPKLNDWYKIYDPSGGELKNKSEQELDNILEKSPYYKSISNVIDFIEKVKMQGKIQKWVDHSISVTHNLPSTITTKEVNDIYFIAWKSGCKGVTIYRDGSLQGVLVDSNDSSLNSTDVRNGTRIHPNPAPKRPKELECDIYHVTALSRKWVVLVGLLSGDPYEVFAFKETKVSIHNKFKHGKLVKVKSGHYNLIIPDVLELNDITNLFDRDEQEVVTRLLSWGSRHGGGIKFAVETLNKSGDSIASFSKAIARTLKKYIKDDELPTHTRCPNCNELDGLIYKEGCEACKYCEYTKC